MKSKEGYIYIFKSELGYKIGVTKRTPEERLKEFSKLPFEVQLVYSKLVSNCYNLEKNIHWIHESKRINSEWFDLDLKDYIRIVNLIEQSV